MLTYLAPAKINLVLEVLGKRDDSYHEIKSLVQAISLCDELSFEEAGQTIFECNKQDLQTPDNLVIQAAEMVKRVTGCERNVKIKLEKRIPWGAGLGGGSGDAAATLLALNSLWELRMTNSDLLELAAKLGSDVPFFVCGGTALVEGRGEKVTPLADAMRSWFVLLLPPLPKVPGKTGQLYSLLKPKYFTKGQFVKRAFDAWSEARRMAPSLLFNVFDEVALDAFPDIEKYRDILERTGVVGVHLAGSGPGLFAMVESKAKAVKAQRRLCQLGLDAYAVSTLKSETGY